MLKRFALIAAILAAPASADILVTNVNGVRVGEDGTLHRFRALTIAPDGRVRQLIENPELARLANISGQVDGGGRTLLPGMIDGHGHFMGLGLSLVQLDLTGTRSLADLQQRLRAYARANPGSEWIVGRGWNQELWPTKRFPTRADLDAIVPGRPVWLGRVDGHAAVANSAALKAAGVTRATAEPSGGRVEKDSKGEPTGLLVDAAMDLVERKVPAPTPAQKEKALLVAQTLLLKNGITAIADMGTSADDWNAIRHIADRNGLNLRVMSYGAGTEELFRIGRTGPTPWLYSHRLKLVGVKLYSDGALGSRGAWLKHPYSDAPTRGLPLLSTDQLRSQASVAASAGFQVAVHAIGDAANALAIDVLAKLKPRLGDTPLPHRIEHVQVVDPADIQRLSRARVIASMQPVHQTSDRLMAEDRLGSRRLEGAYAWRTLERAGVMLAFGSDFPVENVNPFHGIAAAVSRQDPSGQPPGGWRPHERLSVESALAGFTRNAAHAGSAGGLFGSLAPGELADFILVDRDITRSQPIEVAATNVVQTWVGGQLVYDRDAKPPSRERD